MIAQVTASFAINGIPEIGKRDLNASQILDLFNVDAVEMKGIFDNITVMITSALSELANTAVQSMKRIFLNLS